MSPRDGFLAYCAHAVSLTGDEQAALRGRLRVREIDAGDAWVREGETCREVAFVAQGVLRVYFLAEGDEVTAYFASEGEMVSDYESVLTGEVSRQTIEAVEPTTLAVLRRENMHWAFEHLAHGEKLGRLIAEKLFLATHRRLASFYLESAEDRYARLLDEQPDLVQRVPQHILASYIGVRPQSLSRIRRRMGKG
ncbi:MAG: Crp/Fnr family transcriptional regulator [Bacteroidota bacterium]